MPLNSSYIRDLVGAYQATNKRYEEQRAAAIRWQGAQDYERMVKQGADPREALRRTAPRLFFNDPRALAATVPSMLSQPGGLVTDPESGRRFTVDRFGNYKPLNEPTSYRKFTDAQGNTWTLAVPGGDTQAAGAAGPGIQTPQMFQAGGQNFLLQSGRSPTRVPRTPEEEWAGRAALERATKAAQPIFNKILEYKKRKEAGYTNTKYGLGSETYDQGIKRLEEDLAGLGFLPSGQPKPGTDLYKSVFGEQPPAPAEAGAMQQGIAPPGAPGVGYNAPIGPTRPPLQQQLIPNPRFGTSPWEPRMIPSGPATRGGTPAAPTRQLGPNQVKKYWRGKAVIWDTQQNKAVDWYAE